MNEDRNWLIFWVIFGITIVSFTAVVCYSSYKERQLFVEGKYVECILPGSSTTKWCR